MIPSLEDKTTRRQSQVDQRIPLQTAYFVVAPRTAFVVPMQGEVGMKIGFRQKSPGFDEEGCRRRKADSQAATLRSSDWCP
jgi:hypothetical protein